MSLISGVMFSQINLAALSDTEEKLRKTLDFIGKNTKRVQDTSIKKTQTEKEQDSIMSQARNVQFTAHSAILNGHPESNLIKENATFTLSQLEKAQNDLQKEVYDLEMTLRHLNKLTEDAEIEKDKLETRKKLFEKNFESANKIADGAIKRHGYLK